MTNKITMTIGDNETFECDITDENDDPISLESTKIWFTLRKSYSDSTFLIQKKNTLAGGSNLEILITDEPNGLCEIYLLPADTKEFVADVYVYDVQVSNIGYGIKTVIRNRIFLENEVTKVET